MEWTRNSRSSKGINCPKPAPSTPFPQQEDNLPPALDENDNAIGVSDQEAREVHDAGYRNVIGELLWPARNSYPCIAHGVRGNECDSSDGDENSTMYSS